MRGGRAALILTPVDVAHRAENPPGWGNAGYVSVRAIDLGEPVQLADLRLMLDCRTHARDISDHHEVEITDAAIGAYGRLLRAVGRAIRTHAAGDGGLICEDRINRTRPIMWRISPDGAVLPDRRYHFATGAFITAILPRALTNLAA